MFGNGDVRMLQTEETSEFVRHEPCPVCGSRNNLARYTDGHGYCFGCEYYEPGEGTVKQGRRSTAVKLDLIEWGEYKALTKRGISEETCHKFGYTVGKDSAGIPVQIAPYYDAEGNVTGDVPKAMAHVAKGSGYAEWQA